MAEGGGLLNRYTGKTVSEVRILSSPPAKEAADFYDILVVCGFAFEPKVGDDSSKWGGLTILKARMNPDLHMAQDLKKTGAGNMFMVFGEPDINLAKNNDGTIQVEIKGVDIFKTVMRS